jgi:hypothetical protein
MYRVFRGGTIKKKHLDWNRNRAHPYVPHRHNRSMGPLPKTRVQASAATIKPAHTPITIAVNSTSVMVPKRASPHQDAMPVHTSDSQR